MRTYSGFLLFEDVLDYAPTTDTDLYQFVSKVLNPTVKVISENCLTAVGKLITINYEIEGLVELATGLTIDKTRITALLASGIYKVPVRDLSSCTSVSGICRKCYAGTYIDVVAPAVGSYTKLAPEYNYQTDVFIGNGATTVFTLSESSANYTKVLVIINGIIQSSGYTISSSTMTMALAPSIGTNVVVKFYTITGQPFVGYLSKTYSGSLLGMRALITESLHIRPSLGQEIFSDEELNTIKQKLHSSYKVITSNYMDYVDTIQDRLEKAIYIAVLYGLYSNVTT